MSWSISTKTVAKSAAAQAINDLSLAQTGFVPADHAIDQLETAKRASQEILKSIPGPYVSVSMSGHSNGVGWQKKEGYANECINVNVSQQTEESKDV